MTEDSDKAKIIIALLKAPTDKLDNITAVCQGMTDHTNICETIEALVTVSANDNFDGIINDIQALCVGMTGSDKAKTIDALVTVSANDNFDGIINDIQALCEA